MGFSSSQLGKVMYWSVRIVTATLVQVGDNEEFVGAKRLHNAGIGVPSPPIAADRIRDA